jgi:glucose-6-phosphate isomerase
LNGIEKGDYLAPEAFLCLPSDMFVIRQIEELVEHFKKDPFKYVVVIGIGGSNLGTLAIYEALFGVMDAFDRGRSPKLLFLDTTSESKSHVVAQLLENECSRAEDFVINIISKSGGTTETAVNFELLYEALRKKFGDIHERVVVTTDEGSPLWDRAQQKSFTRLSIPANVGGRYSVFSAVGLFPLGLAGVSLRELQDGARDSRDTSMQEGGVDPSLVSAAVFFHWYTKNVSIGNNFFFAPELESLGKWYRQLMGESLGKEHATSKKVVHSGITPIVSIGSTDLHSMAQLYFGGPRDKFTTIISVQNQKEGSSVPASGALEGLVKHIEGKTAGDIMEAIVVGVRSAYADLGLPYMTVEFPVIKEYTLGAYLQYKMQETIYLAHLMQVNAFDQPNVEQYKVGTKKALENS